LRDPSIIESADYLVIESTYGNRLHNERVDKAEYFLNLINSTIEKGGNVIIPSFAVGRTQELIYELNKKKEVYDEKLKMLFATPVILTALWPYLRQRCLEIIWTVMMRKQGNILKTVTILWIFRGFSLPGRQRSQRH